MISCPNCAGNIRFDILTQQLSCEYCYEQFDPYTFDSKSKDAEETTASEGDYEVTVFCCPQCGGEILSTDNAAAGFCSFCGASTILFSRISHEKRPDYIIPFKKTKDDCKQAYADLMKKAIFAPKELKDPRFIDGFRGIYMPYWAFYITQKGPLALPAKKEYRRGDYIYTDHFMLEGTIDSYYKGLSYDASSSFADNISEAIAPYDLKGMKAFTPGYLCGFYADTSDVDASVYQPEAESTAYSQTLSELTKLPEYRGVSIESPSGSTEASRIYTKTESVDRALFPVWFMSYRNKDRVAYVTINGQSGKISADLPIDAKKYLLGSLLLAIPLFFVLMLFTLLPKTLLTISGFLALFSAILYTTELRSIAKKDSFASDRGILFHRDPGRINDVTRERCKENKPKGKKVRPVWLFMVFYLCLTFAMPALSMLSAVVVSAPFVLWLGIMIGMVIFFAIGVSQMGAIEGTQSVLGYVLNSIAILAGGLITLLQPVHDIYYYGGTIFVLCAVCISFIDIIRYYNVLSTRRLPQFNKQGGDDRA